MMLATNVMPYNKDFMVNEDEPILKAIFNQYERVIIESIITSFGLDLFIKDQHGGDVDTINNVRKISTDPNMKYKNKQNESNYENRGQYNSSEYHQDARYIARNKQAKIDKLNGVLYDDYTGQKIAINQKTDLDHTISAKEIHDDRGRCLAGLTGVDLANSAENLNITTPDINRRKKAKTAEEFIETQGQNLSDSTKENMREKDKISRKSYDKKVNTAYYTSPQFWGDTAKATAKLSVKMGVRQALGFVFAEMWFSVKAEYEKVYKKGETTFSDMLTAVGLGIKKGFNNAKTKYKEIFEKFLSGSIAGALSSLTTTICNIFFTTAKNVVKVIRNSYASLVQALKVLLINPDDYTLGVRVKETTKIIATGASVVVGVLVSEAIEQTPIGKIPVIGDIVQSFCGAFVTGILSCTFLFFLDRSKLMNELFNALDRIHTIETEINYYKEQAEYFEMYAAMLMDLDIDKFAYEVNLYSNITAKLENATSQEELNQILLTTVAELGISLPWGDSDFDDFMNNKDSKLIFV